MHGLVRNIWIFLVARTLVVLGTVSLPVTETHPAKVVLAVEALHMIAAPVLLDADVTLGTVLRVRTDVVRRLAIVRTLGQPLADDLTVRWRMIVGTAPEAEARFAHLAGRLLRANVLAADNDLWGGRNGKAKQVLD